LQFINSIIYSPRHWNNAAECDAKRGTVVP